MIYAPLFGGCLVISLRRFEAFDGLRQAIFVFIGDRHGFIAGRRTAADRPAT
jgi:hypothetical protein